MSATEYPVGLDARVEDDETAAPVQDSSLGRQYYFLDDDADVDS